MTNSSVSVIIPNFNGAKLLLKNLPSVVEAFRESKNRIKEIILVDDGSTDESVNIIKSNFPEVKIIKHTQNRGFSAAVNTGVRMANGDLVALINTDVNVSNNFLENVIGTFSDQKVFGVSLNDGVYWWSKGKFEDGFIVHSPGGKSTRTNITFWISGGTGVFRRKVWVALKGMDEELFTPFYWEDLDLSYRALKRGYRLFWEPNALVVHDSESTIGNIPKDRVNKIWERNQLLFIWKNLTSKRLFRKHIWGVIRRTIQHPGYIKIVFLALLKIAEVLRKRKREIKESKVSDEAIFSKFK